MATIADARLALWEKYAGLAMAAALAGRKIPKVVDVYGELGEDGTVMLCWEVDDSEETGGLPLYAFFDLAPDPNKLDPQLYVDALMRAERDAL